MPVALLHGNGGTPVVVTPPTVEERTPDLSCRMTWRPEQFTRCTNPSFATNTTGWSVSAGINAAGSSITRITTDGPDGDTTCGELVTNATADSGVDFDLGSDRYFADADVSSLYVVSLWLKRMSGSRSAKVILGSLGTAADRATTTIEDVSDQWREYAVTWRPSGARTDAELAVVTGDGTALTVRIGKVRIYSPLPSQVENGSFLTDTTTGWNAVGAGSSLERLDSEPFVAGGGYLRVTSDAGAGSLDGASYTLGTRLFMTGRTYRARAAVRLVSGSATPRLVLGVVGTDIAETSLALTTVWQLVTLDWSPSADRSSAVVVRLDEDSHGAGVWDMAEVEVYEALDDIPVRALDTVRGAMSGGNETPTGTITGEVADITGLYDPRNQSSVLYGSVRPGVPFLARAVHDGLMRGLACGRIDAFEQDPYTKTMSFSGSDGLAFLGTTIERPFRSDLSFAQARAEALLAAGLSARQLSLTASGPESGTFYDGTDDAVAAGTYLAQLDAATGTQVEALPSACANVGWVYRSVDRATLTAAGADWSIVDDSRGPLPGMGVSEDTLVTRVRLGWQGYEATLPPLHSVGGLIALPWGDVSAAQGYGVVVIGADPALYPNETPYLSHTAAAFGSSEAPDPEEVWTIERIRVVRKGRVIRRKRRKRSLRWDEPVFPMTLSEPTDIDVDFAVPMEGISVEVTGTATATWMAEPSRVTITLSAGTVSGLAVIAKPWLPLPEASVSDRSASAAVHEAPGIDDAYVNGPGQAEGLAGYAIWRYDLPRVRPVVTDGLEPVRQLGVRVGDHLDLTVTRYRVSAMRTVVRGIRHRIIRPWPWHTDYALEELPDDGGDWVTIGGGASKGIGSSATLAH
jgi:hypothetical protein